MKEGHLLKNYFERADIVALGETGHGKHAEAVGAFLKQFGPVLTGIFVEFPVNEQPDTDHYMATGEIQGELRHTIEGARREGKDIEAQTRALLDGARTHQVPVFCIDSSKVETEEYFDQIPRNLGYYFSKTGTRNGDMSEAILAQYKKAPGKYVVIGGSWHFENGYDRLAHDSTVSTRLREVLGEKYTNVLLVAGDTPTDNEVDYDDVVHW